MPAASLLSAPLIVQDPGLLREVGILRIHAWQADEELPSFASRVESGQIRTQSVEKEGFRFLDGVRGCDSFSPAIPISACNLILDNPSSIEVLSGNTCLETSEIRLRFAVGGER